MSLLEHIANDVQAGRRREESWSELRNIYFREGTPEDGWRALLEWANRHNIDVRAEEVRVSGRLDRRVYFTPREAQTS
jgi:hypothetical protein